MQLQEDAAPADDICSVPGQGQPPLPGVPQSKLNQPINEQVLGDADEDLLPSKSLFY